MDMNAKRKEWVEDDEGKAELYMKEQ